MTPTTHVEIRELSPAEIEQVSGGTIPPTALETAFRAALKKVAPGLQKHINLGLPRTRLHELFDTITESVFNRQEARHAVNARW